MGVRKEGEIKGEISLERPRKEREVRKMRGGERREIEEKEGDRSRVSKR